MERKTKEDVPKHTGLDREKEERGGERKKREMFTVHFVLYISLLFFIYFTCFGNVNTCFPYQ
jgi:hypothetical protein